MYRPTFHCRAVWASLVIGLLLLAPVCAVGEDDPTPEVRAREERATSAAQRLLAALQVSPGQARWLLEIAEEAAKLHVAAYQEQARLQPEVLDAYRAFAAEDRANQGFSTEVERRTQRVHKHEKDSREKLAEGLRELEARAVRLLTPAQRAKLDSLTAGHMSGSPRRAAGPAANIHLTAGQSASHDRLGDLHAELRQLQASIEPEAGPLARHLLHPAAFEPLCKLAGRQPPPTLRQAVQVYRDGTPECPRSLFAEREAEIGCLRKEINNWNLINGLQLDQEQIGQVLALYDGSALGTRPTPGRQAPHAQTVELAKLERAFEDVLNPGQRQVLADYKACLIPPKNLKDPVRVGQASDNASGYERLLERARKLDGVRLRRAVDEVLDREVKHTGLLSTAERQKRAALLRQTARRAAAMSDTEFELGKADLAARIAPPDRLKELHQQVEAELRARDLPGKLAQFMLNEDFIGQLRERGQQLAAGVTPQASSLAADPQAENCEKGCALPARPSAKINVKRPGAGP
jgi:hypothetical protein